MVDWDEDHLATSVPANHAVKHVVWLTSLAIAPGPLARMLIAICFSRSHLRSTLRYHLKNVTARVRHRHQQPN